MAEAAPAGGTATDAASGVQDAVEPLTLDRAYHLLVDKVVDWGEGAVRMLPNMVVAVLVVTVFFALGAIVSRLLQRLFRGLFDSNAIAALLATTVKVAVITTGLFVALDLVGLQKAVISLLAGAGIIGLALGFAFQDMAENFLAGMMLSIRKPFKPGDLVRSQDQLGFVQRLNLRNTVVANFSGQIIYIPNKEIFKNVLENYSVSGTRRIEIPVGVSYGEDLRKVTRVLRTAIEALDYIDEDQGVDVFALEFGDSSINFSVRFWISYPNGPKGYFDAIHEAVVAIKEAFNDEDIVIPFPIRTLDFGIKGGERLAAVLEEQALSTK